MVAFLTPTEDGKLSFILYKEEVPANTPHLVEQELVEWKVIKDDTFIRNKVVVRYNMNPSTQDWLQVETLNDSVIPKYGVREPLVLDTYLRQALDASNICSALASMVLQPITIVDTVIGMRGFGLYPTRKIKITRSRAVSPTGSYNQKVFRIKSVTKDMTAENTKVVALDDLQSMGGLLCTDCYSCQVCYTQEDSCTSCYACQVCYVDQGGCSVCDSCQVCNTVQGGCATCDTCQVCDTCQTDVGGCATCELCYTCDSCVTCQVSVDTCATCQVCNSCQASYGSCATCQVCDTCQLNVYQCATCQICNVCENCYNCEGTCETCQNCVTAQGCEKLG